MTKVLLDVVLDWKTVELLSLRKKWLHSEPVLCSAPQSQHFGVDLVGTYKKAIKGYKRGQVDVPTRIEQKGGYTDTASF